MEALCRLSYSGGPAMIATTGWAPGRPCDDGSMRRRVAIALVPVALIASACLQHAQVNPSADLPSARASFTTDRADVRTGSLFVADSSEERARGLMGVDHLAADGGMVFVFDGEEAGSFWMKDTLIPLSIGFWGADGRLVDILEMEPCTADPCPRYAPRAPYTHALEMNAHWYQDRGIEIGDRVELIIGSE